MKCLICSVPLTRRNYYQWEVNGKRSVSYECTNSDCSIKVGALARCVIQITEPDNVITYYLFRYHANGKLYRIRSYNEGKPNTVLQILKSGYSDEEVISIPRFMTLQMNDDLPAKIQEIHKKLQELLVFT